MPKALALETLKQFRIIYGAARQHFNEIEATCGISGSQVWLLSEIASNPDLGVTQLAENLSIHQTTCSLLLKKLVLKDFVVKTKLTEDHRKVVLVVTASGRALLDKAPKPVDGILPEVLATMKMTDLNNLKTSLEKVTSKLDSKTSDLANHPLADL